MNEQIAASGFVLRADPAGEYDKRLLLLTRELGKITVFARGVRRPGSPYLAAANPFTYGMFYLFAGRSAYTLRSIEDILYFAEEWNRTEAVYYGYYCLELASFYGQENLEALHMVNLLYTTFRAIQKEVVPLPWIRSVFACRMLYINGDFAVPEDVREERVRKALQYVCTASLSRLYAFVVSDEIEEEVRSVVERALRRVGAHTLKSLAILNQLTGSGKPL